MYATRRPSTRQQVIGTFDVTKETAGAEVGDFLSFFLLASQVGLAYRLFLFVVNAATVFLTSLASNSCSCYCKKEKTAWKRGGTGKKRWRQRTVGAPLFAGA